MLTALKDTGDEVRVFLLDVTKQLDREVTGGLGEQGFGLMSAVVEVGGPSGLSGPHPLLASRDKTSRSQDGQLLADGARRGRRPRLRGRRPTLSPAFSAR